MVRLIVVSRINKISNDRGKKKEIMIQKFNKVNQISINFWNNNEPNARAINQLIIEDDFLLKIHFKNRYIGICILDLNRYFPLNFIKDRKIWLVYCTLYELNLKQIFH